jgi:beta-phosphoglucomutase-like phosphatase (HAD superfamily)
MHAIMGRQYKTAGYELYKRIQSAVRQFIEQSTGIQTIAQMDALVGMIADFNLVDLAERLDAWGYKQVYNDSLMEMVNDRLRRLDRGELAASDFIMKGAIEFLHALRAAGVKLYLVSGTDEADTIREASILGYAGLFDGGIYGAKPASRADTKEGIIRALLDEVAGTTDPVTSRMSHNCLVTGDGPVEIRLGRKYGALPLGVASNEERRFGLNSVKRKRLIRAGASLVIPDFSQYQKLATFLHL